MTDEATIQIDAKTKVHRSGDRWAVSRLQPDGRYDMVDHWDGNRRSMLIYLEENHIVPSRTAEEQLAQLPERRGFKADEPRKSAHG